MLAEWLQCTLSTLDATELAAKIAAGSRTGCQCSIYDGKSKVWSLLSICRWLPQIAVTFFSLLPYLALDSGGSKYHIGLFKASR